MGRNLRNMGDFDPYTKRSQHFPNRSYGQIMESVNIGRSKVVGLRKFEEPRSASSRPNQPSPMDFFLKGNEEESPMGILWKEKKASNIGESSIDKDGDALKEQHGFSARSAG